MLMVGTDPVEVERLLLAGELGCPACAGVLRTWGYARWGLHGGNTAVCGEPAARFTNANARSAAAVRFCPRRAVCYLCLLMLGRAVLEFRVNRCPFAPARW